MASLERDTASGNFRIRFRLGNRPFKRTLKTTSQREAEAILTRLEENLRLLERGRLELPPGADPGAFLLSDGKLTGKPTAPKALTLAELYAVYEEKTPAGSKEKNSASTEKSHWKHLTHILGGKVVAQSLTTADIQRYVQQRSEDSFKGQPIVAGTIRKETATLRAVWNWAVLHGLLVGASPTRGIKYPKAEPKAPFQTFEEIKRTIDRGGMTPAEQKKLWACLFLTRQEILELLEYIRTHAAHEFIYPMIAFAALTGARRSEILRSRIEDFDFEAGTVLVREKKKDKTKTITYRRIEMAPLLRQVMQDWFQHHPGGQSTISQPLRTVRGKRRASFCPVTIYEATDHFRRTLANSKWSVMRGFHVLRHSFCSNLAAAGVDQRVIDEFMGHQTEEMRRRYRHLFPDQRRKAIEMVFSG